MPKQPAVEQEDYEILNLNGRMLVGVLIARLGGFASVDRTMKRYVPEQVDPVWGQITQHLIGCLQMKLDPGEYVRLLPLDGAPHE